MSTPCIVIDIGNTSTSIGRYENGLVSAVNAVRGGMASRPENVDRALQEAGADTATRAVLASVVPNATPHWLWLLKRLYALETLVLTHETPMPIGIRYPKPETIGADRLANACGAAHLTPASAIIADFGTALTFDVLSDDHAYLGGVIAPGLPLMTSYLHEKTAKLPLIDLQSGPLSPIGTSTENAMRLGALVGHRGMVREVTNHLLATTGPNTALYATGGYAQWAIGGTQLGYQIDPNLTLFGLGIIHDFNEP